MQFKNAKIIFALFAQINYVHGLEEVAWGKDSPFLILPGFFPITNASAPGGINMLGFQMAEAFKCAVQQLNASQIIPGLTIRAQVGDSGTGAVTAGRLNRFATRWMEDDKLFAYVFGGSNSYSEAKTANSLFQARDVSLIHYFPQNAEQDNDALLEDKNFIRSYPHDLLQIQPMLALLEGLNLNIICYVTFTEADKAGVAFYAEWVARYPAGTACLMVKNADLTNFITCLKRTTIRQIVVFGAPNDVVAGFKSLQEAGAISASTLLFAASSWGTDDIMRRLINEDNLSATSLLSTFTARPTSGDLSLFGYCLSQITADYDPNYVIGYDSTGLETFMPLSTYRSFWEATFGCSFIEETCTSEMKLNNNITIHRGVNYIIDSVIGVVNSLANVIYNCDNIKPYIGNALAGDLCVDNFINGTALNKVHRSISFPGLTGRVQYHGNERSLYQYDYFQFNGKNFTRSGNWSTTQKSTFANANYTIPTADRSLLSGKVVLLQNVLGTKSEFSSQVFGFIATPYNEPISIVVALLSVIGLVATLSFAGFVFYNADNPVIKRSSPLFCGIMLFGIGIIYIDILLWAGTQTQALCIIKIWIPILGFGIIMGPMLAKTFRIWKIFDNSKLRQRRILTSHLLSISGAVIGINLLLLVIWTAIDPLQPVSDIDTYGKCQGKNEGAQVAFKVVFALYNGLLLIFGSSLSFLTRNVNSSFNESKFIAYTMYSLVLVMVVLLPIYFTGTEGAEANTRTYVIRSASMLFANTCCLFILFAPKVYHVIKKTKDQEQSVPDSKKAKESGKNSLPTEKTGTLIYETQIKSGVMSTTTGVDNEIGYTSQGPSVIGTQYGTTSVFEKSRLSNTNIALAETNQGEASIQDNLVQNNAVQYENNAVQYENNAVQNEVYRNDSVQNEIDAVQNENEAVQYENNAVQNENEAVQNEVYRNDSVQNENDAVQNENESVQNENDAIQNEVYRNDSVQNELISNNGVQNDDEL